MTEIAAARPDRANEASPARQRIPITRPVLGDSELQAIASVLESGYLVQGPRVSEFERLVAERCGREHAVALTNCTAALEVALHALGIGDGDFVAVTPFSWIATANVIELRGAIPVFVDVDPQTFNIDATHLAEVASSRELAAVMAVDTFGNTAGLSEIEAVCRRAGVPLIEDAACALGSMEERRPGGSFGEVSCISFHPRKIITTGEGGMLVTDDPRIAAFARTDRNHGQQLLDDQIEFVLPARNLRMTEVQGALGVVQMGRLDTLVAERSALANRYDELLTGIGFSPQVRSPGAAVQSYVALCPPSVIAADVIGALRDDGIEATIGTNTIPFTRFYRERYGHVPADLPVASMLQTRSITLPLFPGMTTAEQDAVVAALAGATE